MNATKEFFDDPLSELFGGKPADPAPVKTPPASYNGGLPEGKIYKHEFSESCRKCGGRGFWRPGYPCFTCKGTGKLLFKTSPEARAKSRAGAIARKVAKAATAIEEFKSEYPDVWAWMDGSTYPFAVSLREALAKYGSLTDRQLAAARGALAKLNAAKAATIARAANAAPVNASALESAFAKAATVNRRAALWIGSVRIKPASKKPGVLYVVDKATDSYLGKVAGGRFVPSREGAERESEMLAILADPKAAAIQHGKLTGACAVCSRTLTDPVSVANGIGPICAEKFGW